jgi:hypothetical protein
MMDQQGDQHQQQQPGIGTGPHPTHAVNISVQTGASPHAGQASAGQGQVSANHGMAAIPGQQQQDLSMMQQPGASSSPATSGPSSTPASSSPSPAKPKTGVQDLPKGPKKASTPPKDVQSAQKQQSAVLKARQKQEIRGKNKGPVRTNDPGSGSWPPLSPTL